MIVFALTIVVGCQKTEPVDSQEPKVLRILGDAYTINRTLNYFLVNESNIEVEVIDTQQIYREAFSNTTGEMPFDPEEKIREIITGKNPPDIIYLSLSELRNYVDNGILVSLDEMIHQTDFDIEGIIPSVIEAIRNEGNGSIYALSPTFKTNVLYYNKDFFDKMQMPYPIDRMSWEQVFNFARQLTYVEDGVQYYGFSFYGAFPPYYMLTEHYIDASSIGMFNEDLTHFMVNTPARINAWKEFIALYREGTVAPPYDHEKYEGVSFSESYFNLDLFMGGRAAMTIADYGKIGSLEEMQSGRGYFADDHPHPEPFDWDIVTYPLHSETESFGSRLSMANMMGINAKSEQTELAWKYISFMNGDRAAKTIATRSLELMSRFEYVAQPLDKEINIQAFTLLQPEPDNTEIQERQKLQEAFPDMEWWGLSDLAQHYFDLAFTGEMSVEEALAELEIKGQELLDHFHSEQK